MVYGCTSVVRQRPVHITLPPLANGSQRFHRVFLKVWRVAMRLQRRRIAVLLVDEEPARVIDMPMDYVHQASRLLARRTLKFFEDDGHFVFMSGIRHPRHRQYNHFVLRLLVERRFSVASPRLFCLKEPASAGDTLPSTKVDSTVLTFADADPSGKLRAGAKGPLYHRCSPHPASAGTPA